jgi:hypothetical protein
MPDVWGEGAARSRCGLPTGLQISAPDSAMKRSAWRLAYAFRRDILATVRGNRDEPSNAESNVSWQV